MVSTTLTLSAPVKNLIEWGFERLFGLNGGNQRGRPLEIIFTFCKTIAYDNEGYPWIANGHLKLKGFTPLIWPLNLDSDMD